MNPERVPFVDLASDHRRIAEEVNAALAPLFERAAFIGGDAVSGFEAAFAAAHDVPHCATVKSGTSALLLAMEALDAGRGTEVIVPAFTFIATASQIVMLGAKPVFVDVDPDTACMDPAAFEAAITPATKCVIPVHLYGQPAPMDAIVRIAERHNVQIVEDCAQSHLARLEGRSIGTFGDAAAFSFYPTKNLGAAGDAGAVISRRGDVVDRVRKLANHGRAGRYDHDFLGWNERLDAIQAAVLHVKLRHLCDWTEQRRAAAARYRELLAGLAPWGEPLTVPVERPGATHVYHLFVVRHPRRDDLQKALAEKGIDTGTHYPTTLPAQPAFKSLGYGEGRFPNSEAWAATCLALPMFPGITAAQQERVADAIRSLR